MPTMRGKRARPAAVPGMYADHARQTYPAGRDTGEVAEIQVGCRHHVAPASASAAGVGGVRLAARLTPLTQTGLLSSSRFRTPESGSGAA